MAEREIRHCEKHGDTEFALYSSGNKKHWKCLKCQTEATQKRRDKVKVLAVAYKGGKCQCCEYNTFIGALEFHHTDPNEKDFGISAKGYTRAWSKITPELDKCVLVCSNCHREIHAGIRPCPEIKEGDNDAVKIAEQKFEENYNK